MRIAVIGTGNIGSTLGGKWRDAGHEVVFGSRNNAGTGPGGAPLKPVGEAIAASEVVVLAVPGKAVDEVVAEHGPGLAGKVVIDATNRIADQVANSHETLANAAPGARYVRAFNTLGWENFADPPAGADLFFAGAPEARASTEELITAVGLRPVYIGGPEASGTVDALLRLWFALVQQRGGNRRLAFRLVEDTSTDD